MKRFPPERFLFQSKIRRLFLGPLLSVVMAGAVLSTPASAQVELKGAFVSPPFVKGETVVGKEGWEMTYPPGSPIYTDPDEAQVISTPLVDSGQESTLNLRTAIKNVQIANPGNVFRMEAQLAVAYKHQYQLGGGVYLQFSRLSNMGPFHFGFVCSTKEEPGGLYYWGREGRVLVLPQEQMVENAPYRFVFDVDMLAESFKVEITGKEMSGNAFRHQSEQIRFHEAYLPFKGAAISLFIGNDRPTLVDAYIDYVKIISQ